MPQWNEIAGRVLDAAGSETECRALPQNLGPAAGRTRVLLACLAASTALLLGGCDVSKVYRNRGVRPPSAITTDAYQRSVFIAQAPSDEKGQLRFCAEAAPDAFSALSASIAAEGNIKDKTASLNASINQTGTAFARTQTINMLRESMYRTCERYLSGAISKETMIVQAARDQRMMVQILAIEELGQAARGAASSAPLTVTADKSVVDLVADFRKQERADNDKEAAALADYTKNGGADACGGDPPTDTAKKAAYDKCLPYKQAYDKAAAAHKSSSDNLANVARLGGATPATGAGGGGAGGDGKPPSDSAIAQIAQAIRDVANAPEIDEVVMMCIGHLAAAPDRTSTSPPSVFMISNVPGGKLLDTPVQATQLPAAGASGGPADLRNLCLKIVENRARRDEELRQMLAENASLPLVDSVPSTIGHSDHTDARTLLTYLDSPEKKDERTRRLGLVQAAVGKLRLSGTSRTEINTLLFGGDVAAHHRLLEEMQATEKDSEGKKALGVVS